MAWAAFSFNSRTPLVILDGSLNAQRYVDEILQREVIPFLDEHPEIQNKKLESFFVMEILSSPPSFMMVRHYV